MNAIQEVGVTAAIGSRRVAAVALAAATACHSEPVDEPLLPLAPVATAPAPLSHNRAIALTDDNTACVINSFELQIHCVDRNGSLIGKFGGNGEGPGEFLSLTDLRRGADGRVGVFHDHERLTTFEPAGNLLSETGLPTLFSPEAPLSSTISGSRLLYSPPRGEAGRYRIWPGGSLLT